MQVLSVLTTLKKYHHFATHVTNESAMKEMRNVKEIKCEQLVESEN